jgi:uncharacterized protein YegP (UPF0339 family)
MIILNRSTNNQFYFTVKAKNGKVLVTSELYVKKGNAETGISALFYAVENGSKTRIIDNTKKPSKYPGRKK